MVWDCVFCRTIYLCSLVAKLWEIKCSLTTVSATDEQSDMSMCDLGGAKVSSWNKETRNSVSQTLKSRGNNFYACRYWTTWEPWGISGATNKSHKGEERKSKLVLCLVEKCVSFMMITEVMLYSAAFMRTIPFTEILDRLGWGTESSIQKSKL